MLTPASQENLGRVRRRERKLWDQPNLAVSLGCSGCPELGHCGGIATRAHMFDCLGNCCGDPVQCTKVCRTKAADFTQRVREIGGFGLGNTPRTTIQAPVSLPQVVPVLYHGDMRQSRYSGPAVALSLHRLIDKRTGEPKFKTAEALRAEYGLADATKIILTGTDQDPPLERWWGYGEDRRREIIAALLDLGVTMVTTPNYSLFSNAPRWDDLHSMKRIAIVHAEFQGAGLLSALHVNGRTRADFCRWGDLIAERPEITHLAYEFTTGAGRAERRNLHTNWLGGLAERAGRPLTLVVRGGYDLVPELTKTFAQVVMLDTSAFMKAMNRQRAVQRGNMGIEWTASPTAADEPLDEIFEHNVRTVSESLSLLMAPPLRTLGAAAA